MAVVADIWSSAIVQMGVVVDKVSLGALDFLLLFVIQPFLCTFIAYQGIWSYHSLFCFYDTVNTMSTFHAS